jgi:hypothetical protein
MVVTSLMLAGCGEIGLTPFGLKDTSLDSGDVDTDDTDIDDTDTDDTDTDDTDTDDTDTDDTDTDDTDTDTTPELAAPELIALQVEEVTGEAQVSFIADDDDDDLEGGSLELIFNGTSHSLNIPYDLDVWNPGGTSIVTFPLTIAPCSETTLTVSGYVVDDEGLSSPTLSDSTVVSGDGSGFIAEDGDTLDELSTMGTLLTPAVLCGDIWGAGNDGSSYTSDIDFIGFHVTTATTLTFSLTWDDMGSDYDLALIYNDLWFGWSYLNYSETDGTIQPESFTATLDSYTTYYLRVGAWSGKPSNWQVTVD